MNENPAIESNEPSPLVDPRTVDDPTLPRVLVIGDSISMNYHDAAKSALEGVANYHRIDDNGSSTAHGVENLRLWLGNYRDEGLGWNVIQFNHGLHDLKQPYDEAAGTWGAHQVPIEDYRKNLAREIQILKPTGAKLIWCTTTPVPNSSFGTYSRRQGEAAVYNEAAMEVISSHPEIQVNDLHALVSGHAAFDKWREGDNVHFQGPEQKVLGLAVADAIIEALK